MLTHALSWFGEVFHEGYHQLGDVSEERVIGLNVLVKALHHEGGEGGLLFCEVDDLLAQLDVGTNGDDDVFDEIVAVAEALILEQLCLRLLDLYGLGIIGADGLLDLSLHFYLLLLFFLDQEELFLELALQLAQDVPAVLLSYHVVDYNIIKISLDHRPSIFWSQAGVGGGERFEGGLSEEFGVRFWGWDVLEVFVDYW